MFDFEKLEVYQVARSLNKDVLKHLFESKVIDMLVKEQWKRSSMNSVLMLAEGVGKMTDADKHVAFTSARSAVYECVAVLHLVADLGQLDEKIYQDFYNRYEQLSKMLLGMYRSKS